MNAETGTSLVEALVVLLLVALAVCMNLELVRRSYFEVLFQHATFLYVRDRALGASEGRSRSQVHWLFEKAWGKRGALLMAKKTDLSEVRGAEGLLVRAHIRYRALVRFPYRGQWKHHFEITKKCLFPF